MDSSSLFEASQASGSQKEFNNIVWTYIDHVKNVYYYYYYIIISPSTQDKPHLTI